MKWAVELSEFDITFEAKTAVKSQALAEFLVDFEEPDIPAETFICMATTEE